MYNNEDQVKTVNDNFLIISEFIQTMSSSEEKGWSTCK